MQRGRVLTRAGRRAPLLAAAAAFVLSGAVLFATQHQAPAPLAARAAVADALHSPQAKAMLRGIRWDSSQATALDGVLERVDLFRGSSVVAEFAVDRRGQVEHVYVFTHARVPYGNWIAWEPALIALMAGLFALMCGVWPLWRLRNLDVLAALSLTVPALLLQQREIAPSVLSAVPGLAYLLARCLRVAFRPTDEDGDFEPPAASGAAAAPLFDLVVARLGPGSNVRILRVLFAALVVIVAMIAVSSNDPVDVIYATMEGATRIIHGILPYGHMPGDIVHGDTYPILSYLAYAPIALVSPVASTWDSVDVALGVAAVCAALAAVGIRRLAPSRASGLRGAIAFLVFPPALITISTGTTDVMLGAMLLGAILLWRRPGASAAVVAAAGWFKLAPFALLPIWLAARRGRALATSVASVAGVSAAMVMALVLLGGGGAVHAMLQAVAYQASRGSPQSLWAALGIRGLQPLGEAFVVALVAGATVAVARRPALLEDRLRLAALSAAILISTELAAAYWAFLYTIWFMPLISASLLTGREAVSAQLAFPPPREPVAPRRAVPAAAVSSIAASGR